MSCWNRNSTLPNSLIRSFRSILIYYIALLAAKSSPNFVGNTLALRAEGKMKPSVRLQLSVTVAAIIIDPGFEASQVLTLFRIQCHPNTESVNQIGSIWQFFLQKKRFPLGRSAWLSSMRRSNMVKAGMTSRRGTVNLSVLYGSQQWLGRFDGSNHVISQYNSTERLTVAKTC